MNAIARMRGHSAVRVSNSRRHGDLQHLEIVRLGDLLVPDAGRLIDGRAGDQLVLAIALVLEDRPALQHVDELEVERMGVARRVGMLAGLGARDERADLAVGQLVEAELAVLEERAHAIGLERIGAEVVDDAELERLVVLGLPGGREQVGHECPPGRDVDGHTDSGARSGQAAAMSTHSTWSSATPACPTAVPASISA